MIDREENQRIGKELYNQDKKRSQERNSYRGPANKGWDEGNNFHTGPSPRGAQDSYDQREGNRGGAGNSSYNQGQNAHLNDHYGSRQNSAYRNEERFLDHGDQRDPSRRDGRGNAGGSQPGNYNELPATPDKLHREGPGSRSRYKESDYRYGSGSHNWYREGRYTPNEDRDSRDERGFFDRVKDGWNDIMHSDDPDYQQSNRNDRDHDRSRAEELSSRKRYGGEQFRDRHYDNGYEGGPRWADETDSGNDDYYKNKDRDQRYRR